MDHSPFVALLLITLLALVVPILSHRFREVQIPIVVGEILAGVVIGRSGLNLVESSPTLDFLAEFGFAFLMFLSGLEVDFSLLISPSGEDEPRSVFEQPLLMASLFLLATMSLALLASLALQTAGMVQNPLLMALILSTTSLGVVVPVLKEKGMLSNQYGQTLLVAASISDFVTLLLLTMAIAFRRKGLTLDLLLIPALLAFFGLVARESRRLSSTPWLRRLIAEMSHATAQLRIRGAFALMVGWVVLAQALGLELILGAFLAGAIAGLLTRPEDVSAQDKLDAIGYGFFIPIFFIMVGANFNLPALLASPQALLLAPMLIVLAYALKIIPGMIFRLRFDWRHAFAGGLLLSSRLSLIIAASAIALTLGAISEEVNSATVLLAVVTCSISPMLFNRLMPQPIEERRQGVIIVGTDQMAPLLARRLQADSEQVIIVSTGEAAREGYFEGECCVVFGDPTDEQTLIEANAEEAEGLIALCSDPKITLRVIELARDRFRIPILVARVADIEGMTFLQEQGIRVVQPALATAIALEGALRYPTVFDVLADQQDGVEVREGVVANQELHESRLRGLKLPGNALVLSVHREQTVLVPDGETRLRLGDRVGVIGSPEAVEEAIELFESGICAASTGDCG